MISIVNIQGHNSPELAERVLRIARHRGFELLKIEAEVQHENNELSLSIKVSSTRDITLLTKQLDKVFGIISVNIETPNRYLKATA